MLGMPRAWDLRHTTGAGLRLQREAQVTHSG